MTRKEKQKIYRDKWKLNNPDKFKDSYKKSYTKHRTKILENQAKKRKDPAKREQQKWYHIKRTYGLSREQWFKMYEDQNGACYLCLRHMDKIRKSKSRVLTVDHCHKTGKIRGLLCSHCNKNILPAFERDNSMGLRIVQYLYRDQHYGIVPDHEKLNNKNRKGGYNERTERPRNSAGSASYSGKNG